jgi:arylsulfatase A-like enzyme
MKLMLLALTLAAATVHAAPKPNVLLIVSDDQGYADTGFQGGKQIPTPHLDRLAGSGLRCTSGYASHPFCSPTRAGLMTGRYQQRFGHEMNPNYNPSDSSEGLPLTETLLPQHLKKAGYVTGWVGKWHLGATPAHEPQARGFDETFGFIGGGHQFKDWKPGPGEYVLPLRRNGDPVPSQGHLTTQFGDEAAAFVNRHTDQPWFLYLAFNAPHSPEQPTAERRERFKGIEGTRGAYCAQVSLMDDAIGDVMNALEKTKQRERTLVFFFSDNGGQTHPSTCADNGPLRAAKGEVYEGGVRVPYVVSWPARLPAGKDYDPPVSSLDVFATALAAAGAEMPADKTYDSVNLVPYLAGETKGAPHERLYWRVGGGAKHAVREGDWKLVRHQGKPDELYNVATDLGEKRDLAAAQPDRLRELAAALDAWDKQLVPPVFRGLGQRKAGK